MSTDSIFTKSKCGEFEKGQIKAPNKMQNYESLCWYTELSGQTSKQNF